MKSCAFCGKENAAEAWQCSCGEPFEGCQRPPAHAASEGTGPWKRSSAVSRPNQTSQSKLSNPVFQLLRFVVLLIGTFVPGALIFGGVYLWFTWHGVSQTPRPQSAPVADEASGPGWDYPEPGSPADRYGDTNDTGPGTVLLGNGKRYGVDALRSYSWRVNEQWIGSVPGQ